MAVFSIVSTSEIFGAIRLDAEFYQPIFQKNEALLRKFPKTTTLGGVTPTFVKGIFDIKAEEYVDAGVPFVRINNLKNLIIEDANIAYITPERHRTEAKTALEKYDIVLSKTAYPAASIVQLDQCNCSQDTIAVKTSGTPDFNCYLTVFLNTKFGLMQMQRLFQGNIQSHLSLDEARTIIVPVPTDSFQKAIRNLLEESISQRERSKSLYAEAEALLLRELGLADLDLSHELTYERNFREVVAAGRYDTEYFRPKYTRLIERLRQDGAHLLGHIATFSGGATPLGADYPSSGVPFLRIQNVANNYLDLDDVVYVSASVHNGQLTRSQLAPGDVLITITGRIGTSAVVPENLSRSNINQHIARIRLKDSSIDPYFLAAFLNSFAGRFQSERESYGTTREALPYYCLEKLLIPKASPSLQKKVRLKILEAQSTQLNAKQILEDAKRRVEEMILKGE